MKIEPTTSRVARLVSRATWAGPAVCPGVTGFPEAGRLAWAMGPEVESAVREKIRAGLSPDGV